MKVLGGLRGAAMENTQNTDSPPETTFVQVAGRWAFDKTRADYQGRDEKSHYPNGVCLVPTRFRSGTLSVRATLGIESAARLVIGYEASTPTYYSVGIGGYGFAYVIDEFSGQGWRSLASTGASSQIKSGPQDLEASVSGQRISLSIDGICVLKHVLPSPLQGEQVGLFAWGDKNVTFDNFRVRANKPRIFVVMQFGEPYDFLYQDVILPVAQKLGFEALRADDVYRPGVILQDIIREIIECDVVVADITPVNANVFYELGYAHATQKPTILLANRSVEKLPFDVSGYRVVYYSNTIRGKSEIMSVLEKHLQSIRSGGTAS